MKSKKYRKPRKKNKTMRGGGFNDLQYGNAHKTYAPRENHKKLFEAINLFGLEHFFYNSANAGANTIGDVIENRLTVVYGKLFDEETQTYNGLTSPNTEKRHSLREKTKEIMNEIIAESCKEVNFDKHKILAKKKATQPTQSIPTKENTAEPKSINDTNTYKNEKTEKANSIFSLLKLNIIDQYKIEEFFKYFVSPEFLEGVMDSDEMHEMIDNTLNEINWEVLRKESTHEKMKEIINNTANVENGFELKKIKFVKG